MVTVEIRNIDDDAFATLRRRAAESGRTLEEYLRGVLESEAQRRPVGELLGEVRACLAGSASPDAVVEAQRSGRERREDGAAD